MHPLEANTNEKTKQNYQEISFYILSGEIDIKTRRHRILENIAAIALGCEGFPGQYPKLTEHFQTLLALAKSNLLGFEYSRDYDLSLYTLTDQDVETTVAITGLHGKYPARVEITTKENNNLTVILHGDFDFSVQEMN